MKTILLIVSVLVVGCQCKEPVPEYDVQYLPNAFGIYPEE
jgi:uncharacterized protein YcfL